MDGHGNRVGMEQTCELKSTTQRRHTKWVQKWKMDDRSVGDKYPRLTTSASLIPRRIEHWLNLSIVEFPFSNNWEKKLFALWVAYITVLLLYRETMYHRGLTEYQEIPSKFKFLMLNHQLHSFIVGHSISQPIVCPSACSGIDK